MEHKELDIHLAKRPAQLEEVKKKGVKIIGYFPGNYVPEEIIYASGAVPLCLVHGGSPSADAALSVLPDIICPFARAQIGERALKNNPYYSMIDMLVAPITCQHLKKVAETWEYYGDIEIFKLGIPHQYDGDFELIYYANRLIALRDMLQAFTGNEITGEKISQAIDLYNKMREFLKKISLLRRGPDSPLRALDFFKLNHASFYADPVFMVDILDSVYNELMEKQPVKREDTPRLLMLAPNMAYGDYKIPELVQAAGGEIVIEEICEGIRYYWKGIEKKGDLFQSLAEGYLADRLPCAFMTGSAKKRLDFALNLVTDFNVSGVIWYELINCETYDSESYFFAQKMGERNMPVLILESDYGTADVGQLKVRIEAFMEMIKGGTE
ncbi:MAG: 2-hydroxyacyl-CoA dehydratase family protein [Phycisphaerales bacterium]|jgi:benzoyl-CoA reductase/2-hydroxyglutaryl-CoA dehydratase subunit BcrC/BadD/HgdB